MVSLDLRSIVREETKEVHETRAENQMKFLLTYNIEDKAMHWQIKEPGASEPFIMPDPEKEVVVDLTGMGDIILVKKDSGELAVLDTRGDGEMFEMPDDVSVVNLGSGDWVVNQGESGITVDRVEK